jgi:hypothetical protein
VRGVHTKYINNTIQDRMIIGNMSGDIYFSFMQLLCLDIIYNPINLFVCFSLVKLIVEIRSMRVYYIFTCSVGMVSSDGGLFHVDVIVLDEVHYLSDLSRGTVWEEIVSTFSCLGSLYC